MSENISSTGTSSINRQDLGDGAKLSGAERNEDERRSLTLSSLTERIRKDLVTGKIENSTSPLFDFSDPQIQKRYQSVLDKIRKSHPSELNEKVIDTARAAEISKAIAAHIKTHGDGSLIIISGDPAPVRQIVAHAEQTFGAGYIGASPSKLGIDQILKNDLGIKMSGKSIPEQSEMAIEVIGAQLTFQVEAVKKAGFDSLEEFYKGRPPLNAPRNLIVASEELPLLNVYTDEQKSAVNKVISTAIQNPSVKSVLFIGEDISPSSLALQFDSGSISDSNPLHPIASAVKMRTESQGKKFPLEFASYAKGKTEFPPFAF